MVDIHTGGIFDMTGFYKKFYGRRRKLLTIIRIPNTVRIACCASCQKLSPSDHPNLLPHPNQPPPPASPPPPTSSLFLISLFHFSNSFFFPPSALSNAFLACSCNHRHSKAKLKEEIINLQYRKLYFTM
jgi:hypothetical protein